MFQLLSSGDGLHLTYNFPRHEDQADQRRQVEFPSRPLLIGAAVVVGDPLRVAVLAALYPQLDGGQVRHVPEHGAVEILPRHAEAGPEAQSCPYCPPWGWRAAREGRPWGAGRGLQSKWGPANEGPRVHLQPTPKQRPKRGERLLGGSDPERPPADIQPFLPGQAGLPGNHSWESWQPPQELPPPPLQP